MGLPKVGDTTHDTSSSLPVLSGRQEVGNSAVDAEQVVDTLVVRSLLRVLGQIQAAVITSPPPNTPPNPSFTIDLQSLLRLTVNDGTRDRIQLGKLVSYTDASGLVSPAGFGGRGVDASGNLLWDMAGLAHHVANSIGINDVAPGSFTTPTFPTFNAISGTDIAYTPARVTDIIVFFLAVGRITAGAGTGYVRMGESNGFLGTSGNLQFTIGTNSVQMGWRWYPAVGINAYNFRLDRAVSAGVTFQLDEVAIQVLTFGQ